MNSGGAAAETAPYYLPQQPEPAAAHQLYDPHHQQPIYYYPNYPPPPQHPGPAPPPQPLHYQAPAPDPSAYSSSTSYVGPDGVQQYGYVYPAQQVSYYQDPSHAHQSWVAQQNPAGQYVADQFSYNQSGRPATGTEQPDFVNSYWNKTVTQPYVNNNFKRKKKTKVIQSAWCDVCTVECSSKEVLDQHKLGKKHKKNLEKLQQVRNGSNVAGPSVTVPDNPTNREDTLTPGTKRKGSLAAASGENLETKKQKIMAEGAAPEAVRMCTICNIVCNSDLVFKYHLAGQKHATQLKKQMASTAAVAGQAVIAA